MCGGGKGGGEGKVGGRRGEHVYGWLVQQKLTWNPSLLLLMQQGRQHGVEIGVGREGREGGGLDCSPAKLL